MTDDEDRIAYLAGDDGAVTPDERTGLEELRALLGDPSLWAEPSLDLEDRVATAVAAEVAARPPVPVAPSVPAAPLRLASRRRAMLWRGAGVAAAVAVAIAVAVSVGNRGGGGEHFALALAPPSGAAGAPGRADFSRTGSGWRIELDAPGLPRLDDGRFYQAWMRNAAGTLVPVGTFNEGDDVVLWSGVSPLDFPVFTITQEEADGNQASSGRRVLAGELEPNG